MLPSFSSKSLFSKSLKFQVQIQGNSQIDYLYNILKEEFLKHIDSGHTFLCIYFPETIDSTTFYMYDVKIYDHNDKLSDRYIYKQLKKIFNNEGIIFKVGIAYLNFGLDIGSMKISGKMVTMNLKKNGSKKSYMII